MTMELATRCLDAMTSREVEGYLTDGGDLIFIPFGPVSGHGALLPLGIHAHWAQALSLLLAGKANGLVFPPIYSCYAGATRSFRGTVSFPIAEQVAVLMRIANTLYDQGFRRTVLVGGTTPESTGGVVAARELFDRTERPFWFVEAARALDLPEVRARYEGYPGNFGETLIGLASLKIIGRERPIPLANWARELKHDDDGDQPAEIFPDVVALRRWGAIGFRYHEERNHGNHGTAGIEFQGRLDIDLAVEVLEKSAEALLPALESLRRYAAWLDTRPFQYIAATERLEER
jgi:hypothetical protein